MHSAFTGEEILSLRTLFVEEFNSIRLVKWIGVEMKKKVLNFLGDEREYSVSLEQQSKGLGM